MKLTFEIQDNPVIDIVVDSPTQEAEISYDLADGNTVVLHGSIRALRCLSTLLTKKLQEESVDSSKTQGLLGSIGS